MRLSFPRSVTSTLFIMRFGVLDLLGRGQDQRLATVILVQARSQAPFKLVIENQLPFHP